jgi:uncharacterized membrane protein
MAISLAGSLDIEAPIEDAFSLLCAVEKWPVWLSFLRSAQLADPKAPLTVGSEVVLHSSIPGETEQVYEVDRLVGNHHLSLVGAYSTQRRLDFRIERKTARAKIHIKLTYPAYHGRIGAFFDRVRNGRKLEAAIEHSLELFRGLAEYSRRSPDALLADI